MNLKQLQQEMEKEIDKKYPFAYYFSRRSSKIMKPLYIAEFTLKYMQKVADLYEKRKYYCIVCKDYKDVKDDGAIYCPECGLIIATHN